MHRTAAWRRRHRARLIRKRLKIILNAWGYANPMRYAGATPVSFRPELIPWHGREGALAKSNLRICSCWMCSQKYDRRDYRRETRWRLDHAD